MGRFLDLLRARKTDMPSRVAPVDTMSSVLPNATLRHAGYNIPPDSIAIQQLRLQIRLDRESELHQMIKLLGPHGNSYAYWMWRRQVEARKKIVAKVDRGITVTEEDLLKVAGADRMISGTEASFLLQAHRDAARGQHLMECAKGSDGRGCDESSTHVEIETPPGTPTWDGGAPHQGETGLAVWLRSRPSSIVRTMWANPVLAHAATRESSEYEATVVAWARTMLGEGQLARVDLPAAPLAWLDEDTIARGQSNTPPSFLAPHTIDRAARIDELMLAHLRAAVHALPVIGANVAGLPHHEGNCGALHRLYDPGTESLDFSLRPKRRRRTQSASEERACVYIDGAPMIGAIVSVQAGYVVVRDMQGRESQVAGVLHRDGGPAIVTPDGLRAWYAHGLRSRHDGPAIEAVDPAHDQYWIDGVQKPLDLPPTLYADRNFRARLMIPWQRLGYPVSGGQVASLLLVTMVSEDRQQLLNRVRASSDPGDQAWALANDAMLGVSGNGLNGNRPLERPPQASDPSVDNGGISL